MGVISTIYTHKYAYLIIGSTLLLHYPLESDAVLDLFGGSIIQALNKLNINIKFNFKLSIPITILLWKLYQDTLNHHE